MYTRFKNSYERIHDTFRISVLLVFEAVAAYLLSPLLDLEFYLRSFAMWLERIAIIPQTILIGWSKRAAVLTQPYVVCLTALRLFALCGQAWVIIMIPGKVPVVMWIGEVIGPVVYTAFLIQYGKLAFRIREPELPDDK
jgi:hypothetical protein